MLILFESWIKSFPLSSQTADDRFKVSPSCNWLDGCISGLVLAGFLKSKTELILELQIFSFASSKFCCYAEKIGTQ